MANSVETSIAQQHPALVFSYLTKYQGKSALIILIIAGRYKLKSIGFESTKQPHVYHVFSG